MAFKRRRKLRKKHRIAVGITSIILFLVLGGLLTLNIYNRNHQDFGSIHGKNLKKEQEKLGEITIEGENKPASSEMTVDVINVGRGQAIFIDFGDIEVLIDAGDKEHGQVVRDKIKDKINGKLDYVISSNPSKELCGGFTAIYETFPVETTIYAQEGDSEEYKAFRTAAKGKSEYRKQTNETLNLEKQASITLYNVYKKDDKKEKNSIAFLEYKNFTLLTTSKALNNEERKVRGKIKDARVMIAGNYGNTKSNSLIGVLKPEYLIFSSLPEDITEISKLLKINEGAVNTVLYTHKGDVKITTDGNNINAGSI